MDERYLQNLEQEAIALVAEHWSAQYQALREQPDDEALAKIVDQTLPSAFSRRLKTANSIGFTDIASAPALVPFYDVQVVSLCSDCARVPEKAARDKALLEPLVDAGLVATVVPGGFDTLDAKRTART